MLGFYSDPFNYILYVLLRCSHLLPVMSMTNFQIYACSPAFSPELQTLWDISILMSLRWPNSSWNWIYVCSHTCTSTPPGFPMQWMAPTSGQLSKSLGVIFNPSLSFTSFINSVTSTCQCNFLNVPRIYYHRDHVTFRPQSSLAQTTASDPLWASASCLTSANSFSVVQPDRS